MNNLMKPAYATELVTLNPPTSKEGVILPSTFHRPCSVLVDETVYVIGYGEKVHQNNLAISIKDGSMSFKASMNGMNQTRVGHGCASFTGSDGKDKIAVAGGEVFAEQPISTEIYLIDDDSWKAGKLI